jgi:hypothetical protein
MRTLINLATFGSELLNQCFSPRYITGHAINIGMLCLALILVTAAIIYCKWENKKRASGARDHRLQEESEEMLGYRHPHFKYTI